MIKKSLNNHILAFAIAISLLSLLFPTQNFLRLNSSHINQLQFYETIPCDSEHSVAIVTAEKILPTNNVRLSRSANSQSLYQPNGFDYCFKGDNSLALAASVFCIGSYSFGRKLFRSRRFIIKYIHDQDGHKI